MVLNCTSHSVVLHNDPQWRTLSKEHSYKMGEGCSSHRRFSLLFLPFTISEGSGDVSIGAKRVRQVFLTDLKGMEFGIRCVLWSARLWVFTSVAIWLVGSFLSHFSRQQTQDIHFCILHKVPSQYLRSYLSRSKETVFWYHKNICIKYWFIQTFLFYLLHNFCIKGIFKWNIFQSCQVNK